MKKPFMCIAVIIFSMVAGACNSTSWQTVDDGSTATTNPSDSQPLATENPANTEQGTKPTPDMGNSTQDGAQSSDQSTQGGADGNCPAFFTETWDGPTTNCWLFEDAFVVTSPDQDEIYMSLTDVGALRMRIEINETYLYLPYSQEYSGVSITADVTSNEVNAHEASLFCGFNENGFFEVRFNTAGTYAVYRFDTNQYLQGGNPYTDLMQENSQSLHTGNGRTNTVQIICDQSTVTVVINGNQEFSQYIAGAVTDGGVGVGAISHDNYPVELDFDNIVIAEP